MTDIEQALRIANKTMSKLFIVWFVVLLFQRILSNDNETHSEENEEV